jgi:hypothetical protein
MLRVDLKSANKATINTILEIKGKFSGKGDLPFGQNPLAIPQVVDEQVLSSRLKFLKWSVLRAASRFP